MSVAPEIYSMQPGVKQKKDVSHYKLLDFEWF